MSATPLTTRQNELIDEIAGLLVSSQRLFVVTGAGMSAESGLPTYRGTGGLYNSGRTEQGMPIEQLLSGATWRRNPELTWKYLGEIGLACEGKLPNQGHRILAEMETAFTSYCILTQNIDGLHGMAGSTNVIEIHGNLHNLRCENCGWKTSVEKFRDVDIPPFCLQCNSMLRPDVVLFDEMLPEDACRHLSNEWENGFDVVLSIGTTSTFPYIAEPVLQAFDLDRPAIEINICKTTVTELCSHVVDLPASVALTEIWQRFSATILPRRQQDA